MELVQKSGSLLKYEKIKQSKEKKISGEITQSEAKWSNGSKEANTHDI